MPIQTATTGQLENAQRVAIAKARFVAEHNAPCVNLVEKLTLRQGEKSLTIPKVGQMTAVGLVDGVDLTDSEDIGMTTADLTTGEVGLKVILTDKLVRQENESVFAIVGRQMGDAMARKKDRDVIALFSALNGGTTLGADDKNLSAANAGGCIAFAKSNKFAEPVFVVHHPNAIYYLASNLSLTPAVLGPVPAGFTAELLRDFYKVNIGGTPFFQDGNIDVIGATASGYGVIASKSAMCVLEQEGFNTERERDASLRATEIVVTADYGCWELDDSQGAPLRYEIGALSTSA